MRQSWQVAILGRQAEISLAELESLFGVDLVQPVSGQAAIIKTGEPLPQSRLGGTIKSGQILDILTDNDLGKIFEFLSNFLAQLPVDGKLKLGFSFYGFDFSPEKILKKSLSLKKSLKNRGQSVRIVEGKTSELSSAQVLYNKLTSPPGYEFLIVKTGNETIIARTTAVQDIDAYSERDFGRPKRDAYIGMLPPKLAQIMINLGIGDGLTNHYSPTVLDPFCGTGVVLQESLLMNYQAYGSDISLKMIEYSRTNLQWLEQKWPMVNDKWLIEPADATKHSWKQPIDAVVSEVFLGQPLTSLPASNKLASIVQQADEIASNFLQNIAPQLKSGTRLCLALPAWHLGNDNFQHLKVLDHLEQLGYTRIVFEHAGSKELIYHRPDQTVARELAVLRRN